jgi:transcriptional regulator with XRE-family HTH domain
MAKSLRSAKQERLQVALVEARHAALLTQAEVATKLGHPQSFIAKIEAGERRLDLGEFLEIAEAIGCDPLKLLRDVQKAK